MKWRPLPALLVSLVLLAVLGSLHGQRSIEKASIVTADTAVGLRGAAGAEEGGRVPTADGGSTSRHRNSAAPRLHRQNLDGGADARNQHGASLGGCRRQSADPPAVLSRTGGCGTWRYVGNVTEEPQPLLAKPAAVREHLLHWTPCSSRHDGSGLQDSDVPHALPAGAVGTATPTRAARSPSPAEAAPHDPTCAATPRRFTQADALQCLQGTSIVLFGNSNTRTLYIALEALLRGMPMMSRTAAKQLCDNSRTNHHCWTHIPGPGGGGAGGDISNSSSSKGIALRYFSYTKGLYDDELRVKLAQAEAAEAHGLSSSSSSGHRSAMRRPPDILVGNTGLNSIQLYDDPVWEQEHRRNQDKLAAFVADYTVPPNVKGQQQQQQHVSSANAAAAPNSIPERAGHEAPCAATDGGGAPPSPPRDGDGQDGVPLKRRPPLFVWHLTTPVCDNQPHFTRYRYNAKHWRHRRLAAINAAVVASNRHAVGAMEAAAQTTARHSTPGPGAPAHAAGQRSTVSPASTTSCARNASSLNSAAAGRILLLDGWGMVTGTSQLEAPGGDGEPPAALPASRPPHALPAWVPALCPYYDDPLHHRFLDREMVQVLLRHYCV